MIIDLQESDTWKARLTFATNFISSKDAKKESVMHSEFTSYNDANKVADERFDSIFSRY